MAKYTTGGTLRLVIDNERLESYYNMTKRIGNLFDKIITLENIEQAYYKARKGKMWQRKVKRIEKDKDKYLYDIHVKLKTKTYKTSKYTFKTVYEPKERLIYVLPFYPDRIVQHAIMNVISPLWDSYFIKDSYACRKNKGQHKGSLRCMQFVKRNRYCLQCDISKFYPNINHQKLIEIISRKIKCKDTLNLLSEIITSIGSETNVPIGNLTSQWFGNLYMNELDQMIKHEYKIRDYIRYCDDFLLFSNDKEELNKMKKIITSYIGDVLKMRLSKCNLFHTKQGVDFLGYRHFPNGKILLRKRTVKRIKKRIKALPYKVKHKIITKESALSTIASTKGWLQWANTHNFSIALKLNELKNEVDKL